MRQRICLSGYEVRAFYADRKGTTCPNLGTFYKCVINRGKGKPIDGECTLCKRLADFSRQPKKEE